MITDRCACCGSEFTFDDPSKQGTWWNIVFGMWELLCDSCTAYKR